MQSENSTFVWDELRDPYWAAVRLSSHKKLKDYVGLFPLIMKKILQHIPFTGNCRAQGLSFGYLVKHSPTNGTGKRVEGIEAGYV
jgi:hypothetical protein